MALFDIKQKIELYKVRAQIHADKLKYLNKAIRGLERALDDVQQLDLEIQENADQKTTQSKPKKNS